MCSARRCRSQLSPICQKTSRRQLGKGGSRGNLWVSYGHTVGVLYRLTDELLHARGDDNGVADYDRAFTHTRAALARLTELQQRDRDAVATATLQRLRAARGATAWASGSSGAHQGFSV